MFFGWFTKKKKEFDRVTTKNSKVVSRDEMISTLKVDNTKEFKYCHISIEDNKYLLVNSSYVLIVLLPFVAKELKRLKEEYGVGSWREDIDDCDDQASELIYWLKKAIQTHFKFIETKAAFPCFNKKVVYPNGKAHMICIVECSDGLLEFDIDKNDMPCIYKNVYKEKCTRIFG